MLWSSLFIVCIVQGLFLILLLVRKSSGNPLASRFLIVLLALMVFLNLIYFIVRTGYIPQIFGTSVGIVFLFGPLFYLYALSLLDPSFQWKRKYWLHFIPYLLQLAINLPMYRHTQAEWLWYVRSYLSGEIPIEAKEKLMFAFQDLHLFIYLFLIFRLIRSAENYYRHASYIIPISSRANWLRALFYCFTIILVTTTGLYIFVLVNGKYNPLTNYINTAILSGVIYFIAYKLAFNAEVISPDFAQKYQTYLQINGDEMEKHLLKLDELMKENKVFTNPDLRLATLAEHLNLSSHLVSKLINEKFGKSFTDYVNEYRVKEFQDRINDPKFSALTIYGIALEVGFNSKSSFNTVFKKITGKTPSEYKAP
jgi:AraC-like DNA-binding protein